MEDLREIHWSIHETFQYSFKNYMEYLNDTMMMMMMYIS
jgi:hypothetical protein